MPWQRTAECKPWWQELTTEADPLKFGGRLKLSPGQPRAVHCSGEPSEIPVAKDRRIQDIDRFVVETFKDRAGKVVARIDDELNWPRLIWVGTNTTGYYRPAAANG